MAKKLKAASMDPDDMTAGGLADDFDGEIVVSYYVPWTYPGGSVDHNLFTAALTIKPDEDTGLDQFTEFYTAGDLNAFVPSMDGENPVTGDLELNWANADAEDRESLQGLYALPIGNATQLSKNSKWVEFISAALLAGYDKSNLADPSMEIWNGVYGHFNRIPQKKRSGVIAGDDSGRQRTILVITELKDKPKSKATGKSSVGSSKPAGNSATAKAKPADEATDDLDERVTGAILEALAESKDNTLTKAKLPALLMKKFEGKDRVLAVKKAGDLDFLQGSEAWTFDGSTGVLSL